MEAAMHKDTTLKSDAHPMDAICINPIHTLSMDAVQAADSGHPGTPMALAPVAYCVWQRFLRFDPTIRSGRIAIGLYSRTACVNAAYALLHICGVKAVNLQYDTLGEPSVNLDDMADPCADTPSAWKSPSLSSSDEPFVA